MERGRQGSGHSGDSQENRSVDVRFFVTRLLTLFWGTEATAKILSGYASGVLMETVSKRTIFSLTSIFPLFLVVLALSINELPHRPPLSSSPDASSSDSSSSSSPSPGSESANAPRAGAARQFLLIISALKQPQIWGPMLFVFLLMLTPSAQTAFFFYWTNHLHFRPSFLGVLSVVDGVSSLFGLLIYNLWLKKFPYRQLLLASIFISVIVSVTPLILLFRLNLQLGIPDQWFCLGDTALMAAIGRISLMPLLVLGAETCPPNIEATLYAFLMSTLNIGSLLSTNLGALITWMLGVTSTDFTNLWIVCLICASSPLCVIPFLSLVPSEKQPGKQSSLPESNMPESNISDKAI